MRLAFALLVASSTFCWHSARASQPETLVVDAAIAHLPTSELCRGKTITVVARYRVERVIRGVKLWPPSRPLLVAHRCPHRPRGFSPAARGDATRMQPGSRHRLHLSLLPTRAPGRSGRRRWVDPFAAEMPRYRALRTDSAPRHARIAITVRGGGGTHHRISFDQPAVVVGSRLDADVLLADGDVRPRHLRLEPAGEHTAITPLSGAVVLLNGKPLEARAVVTYKDRIVVGPYELQVSLLTAAWLNKHGK